MKLKNIAVILVVAGIVVGGSYWLFKRFQNDRQRLLGYQPPVNHPFVEQTTTTSDGKTVKTYTAQELEEARKKGQLPKGMNPGPSQAATANEAAVQRSLKTIEEINRINTMNQRLIDQQQRNQHQNR